MVGPPGKRAAGVRWLGRVEQEPEGLLDAPRAVAAADIGGKNLPIPGTWRRGRVAHRDTS